MAKNQKSIYLENDILEYIQNYQEQHKLSSLSIAIERIIFSIMLGNNPIPNIPEKPIKTNSKSIPSSINNIRAQMKD